MGAGCWRFKSSHPDPTISQRRSAPDLAGKSTSRASTRSRASRRSTERGGQTVAGFQRTPPWDRPRPSRHARADIFGGSTVYKNPKFDFCGRSLGYFLEKSDFFDGPPVYFWKNLIFSRLTRPFQETFDFSDGPMVLRNEDRGLATSDRLHTRDSVWRAVEPVIARRGKSGTTRARRPRKATAFTFLWAASIHHANNTRPNSPHASKPSDS